MRFIKPFNESIADLTQEQIDFLNYCAHGKWKLNPDTGLIDIRGDFYCPGQQLNDFRGLRFGIVNGDFSCSRNNLKTLDGSPSVVGRIFFCNDNPLISFEGAPLKVERHFIFYNYFTQYNLAAFLKEIKKDRPGYTELLLTHHFLTPQVIKEEIAKDSYFCYYVSKAWNTPPFKKKQDELTRTLPPETLQKIKDFLAIIGYL